MVFHLYQHAAASNTAYPIDASVQELAARLHDFVASPAGADKACLVQDPSYALLLLALALLPANSPHYAGILNEMGRYLQGYIASHTRADGRFNGDLHSPHPMSKGVVGDSHNNGGYTCGSGFTHNNGFTNGNGSTNNNAFTTGNSYTTNPYFETAIRVYEEAVLIFERAGDGVNSSVVLSNFAQLIRQPFAAATLTLSECQTSYQLLHWVNTHLDAVLRSGCDEARKHAVRAGVWSDG